MNLATVIELSAAAIGLFSSAFFCVGMLHVKDSTFLVIATSMWKSKPTVAKELALQQVDFIFGAILLFVAFFLQGAVKFLPSDVALYVVATSAWSGAAVALIGPLVLLFFLWFLWRAGRVQAARRLEQAVQGQE